MHFSDSDIDFFKKITRQAGLEALNLQRNHIEIHRKKDSSIVTEADIRVQEYLINNISKRYKNVSFIHEENCASSKKTFNENELTVIIDPIDGTAMYSMHLPIWCVSLGIFHGSTPLTGFVFAPGADMFFHCDEKQAYLNDRAISCETSMPINSETNIFYASEIQKSICIDFPGKVRNLGSTAFQACLVADNMRNRTLAFIGKAFLWDWAGALPILLKAGASAKYISGRDFNASSLLKNQYRLDEFLIVWSGGSFEKITKIFQPIA